jgi:hypothetical protein
MVAYLTISVLFMFKFSETAHFLLKYMSNFKIHMHFTTCCEALFPVNLVEGLLDHVPKDV